MCGRCWIIWLSTPLASTDAEEPPARLASSSAKDSVHVSPSTSGANWFAEQDTADGTLIFGTSGSTQFPFLLGDPRVRYGRLWRQGIPYSSLMLNSINHPDERGMKIFADSLMALFP